jgi:hypothetical protein
MVDGPKTTHAGSPLARAPRRRRQLDRHHYIKFVVVNGRLPHPQPFCAMCNGPIEQAYVRDIPTRLYYCDQRCFRGHRRLAAPRPAKSDYNLFWPLNL